MTSLALTKLFSRENRKANMKIKIVIQWIVAGAILCSAPLLVYAADTTNQPPSESAGEQLKNMPPQERRAKIKGLREKHHTQTNAPSVSLTPEQRRAKMKAKVDELQAKKAAGTIKPAEEKELQNLQEALKRAEGHSTTNRPFIKLPAKTSGGGN